MLAYGLENANSVSFNSNLNLPDNAQFWTQSIQILKFEMKHNKRDIGSYKS